MTAAQPSATKKPAHIIVLGNEKGGSGKTTTAMHLVVGLLKLGFHVGTMDIDSRQRSFTRYLEHRRQFATDNNLPIPMPFHVVVNRSPFSVREEAEADEEKRLNEALSHLNKENDFIVIDSPGSDIFLSRIAHSKADTIITPINDSFIDLDVLATVNPETGQMLRPSIYSEMLWEQKLNKAKSGSGSMDWIVMRNRLSNIDAKNKRKMADVTKHLANRVGFRMAPGFGERVIFRELFLQGLTVMDLDMSGESGQVSMSHVAAREEVRRLLKSLNIDAVNDSLQRKRRSASDVKLTYINPKKVADTDTIAKEAVNNMSAMIKERPHQGSQQAPAFVPSDAVKHGERGVRTVSGAA